MIVVTLGTQRFQMNRLIEAMDQIAVELSEDVFIQTGNSTYLPKHCQHKDFVDAEVLQKMISDCSVLVTHAGVGTIMRGISEKKPVVVVPRLAVYQEHVDDHQVQIAEAFAAKQCVLQCNDLEQLAFVIEKAKTFAFQPYRAPESKIENIILEYIDRQELLKNRRKREG